MRPILILGIFGVAAIGCGSSADVIAQADGLCKSAQEKQLTLLSGTSANSKNPKALKNYLRSSLGQTRILNSQLKHLTPPTDLKEQWSTWLTALEGQEEAAKNLIRTVRSGMQRGSDAAYLAALNQSVRKQLERNKLATKLGLEVCGHNPSL